MSQPLGADHEAMQSSLTVGFGPIGAPFAAAHGEATAAQLANARLIILNLRAHAEAVRQAAERYASTDGSSGAQLATEAGLPVDFKEKGPFKADPPPQPEPDMGGGVKIHDVLKLPPYQPGTLSDQETRTVYTTGELEIGRLIEEERKLGISEENVAKNAFERRNALRAWSRELMSNRPLADELNRTNPNLTWGQMLQKTAGQGLTGDDAYKAVAGSSTRSRPSVNESPGVDPKRTRRRCPLCERRRRAPPLAPSPKRPGPPRPNRRQKEVAAGGRSLSLEACPTRRARLGELPRRSDDPDDRPAGPDPRRTLREITGTCSSRPCRDIASEQYHEKRAAGGAA